MRSRIPSSPITMLKSLGESSEDERSNSACSILTVCHLDRLLHLQAYLVDTRQVGQTENIRLSFNHAEELTSLAQFCTSSWPSPPSIYIPRIQTSRSFMTRQSPTTTPRSDSLDLTSQPFVPKTAKPCSISPHSIHYTLSPSPPYDQYETKKLTAMIISTTCSERSECAVELRRS